MKRACHAIWALSGLCALAACGEKPQVLQATRSDVSAYQGASGPFVAQGWKVGDKTSWEQGLKARMQNSQNEYTKLPVAK